MPNMDGESQVALTAPRGKAAQQQAQDGRNSQYTEIQPAFQPPLWARVIRSLWFMTPEWIRWSLRGIGWCIRIGLWTILAAVLATFPGLFAMCFGNIICEATKLPHFSNIGEAMAVGLLGSVFLAAILIFLGSLFQNASINSIAAPITFWLIFIFTWCLISGPFGRVAVKDCELSSFDTFRVAAIGGAVFALVTMFIVVPVYIGIYSVYTYIKRCLQAKPFVKEDVSGREWLSEQFSWCGCGRRTRTLVNDENV